MAKKKTIDQVSENLFAAEELAASPSPIESSDGTTESAVESEKPTAVQNETVASDTNDDETSSGPNESAVGTQKQAHLEGDANLSPTADNPADAEKSPKLSRSMLSIERIKTVKADLAQRGLPPTQRNIIKYLGGSYSTLTKLMRQLEELEADKIDQTITVSDATLEAIKADTRRHLELYRDSVNDKLLQVEDARAELLAAQKEIETLQLVVLDQEATIVELETRVGVLEGFKPAA